MAYCKDCGTLIDTDDDPSCFVEIGNMRRLHRTVILCEPCRERRHDRQEYESCIELLDSPELPKLPQQTP